MKQETSDPIIEQILADCHAVSTAETTSSKSIDRRRFLRQAAKGVIGTGVALGAIAQVGRPSHAQLNQRRQLGEDEFEKPLVPVVEVISENAWNGETLNPDVVSDMMDQAMMKLTGLATPKDAWKQFVLPDDVVGVKINPIGGKALSTHRIIVDKIIEGLYGAGVLKNQIIVWDRFEQHLVNAGYEINQSDQDTRVFASDSPNVGYDDEVFYETDKDIEVRRENASLKSRYTKIVTQTVNVIINVPVLKHHGITGVSGCLKNLAFGSVDNTSRFHSSPLFCDPAIGQIFAHTVLKDKLVLNITDGLLSAFDGGPVYTAEGTWKYGGILVSADPVALDQIAFQTVGEKRKEVGLEPITRLANYIRSSRKLELGTNDLDDMDYQQIKI